MRVIVSIFKFLVGISFLLCSFGLAFVLGMGLSGLGGEATEKVFGIIGIYGALFGFASLVLMTGIAAILISGHDRLCDLVDAVNERNGG